jgi:hypothetical protein
VAEYVWEGEGGDLAPAKLEVGGRGVADVVEQRGLMRIIGASAFSGSGVEASAAAKFSITAANAGFSDVGFRLAFVAPPRPKADPAEGERNMAELKRAVEAAGFVALP